MLPDQLVRQHLRVHQLYAHPHPLLLAENQVLADYVFQHLPHQVRQQFLLCRWHRHGGGRDFAEQVVVCLGETDGQHQHILVELGDLGRGGR